MTSAVLLNVVIRRVHQWSTAAAGLKDAAKDVPDESFKNRVRNKHSGCVIHATDGVFETRGNIQVEYYTTLQCAA